MTSYDEIVTIVDENNNVVGSEQRSKMRKFRMIHRATFILVFNSDDLIFVQKRSQFKDLYPGYYDLTTGGVVLADEPYNISAEREIEEELGIKDIPLVSLYDFFSSSTENRVWGRVFKCVYNGEIVLQESEIESGGFYHINEVEKLIETKSVTPESKYVFNKWLAGRKNIV